MARINETEIKIKISKLQKDSEENDALLTESVMEQLEAIITELVGVPGIMVEISE